MRPLRTHRAVGWVSIFTALVVIAGAASLGAIQLGGGPPADGPALPGARAPIEAIRYPSLQAALDALPEEGGLVRLPPGRFEIREPLVVARGDVALEGSGTATHIVNLNAEGKPAILLAHPSRKESRDAELWRVRLASFRVTGNSSARGSRGTPSRGTWRRRKLLRQSRKRT